MSENLTAEELAVLNAAAGDNGLVQGWEYYSLYRKQRNPNLLVAGPQDWPFSPHKGAKLVRRKKVVAFGEFEVVGFDDNGDPIEDTAAHAFARYVASFADPENAEELAGLTVADLIAKAKAVVDEEEE
ncbi:hypothetical protein ACWDTT_15780 [Streptosporangium sandarakinum]